MTDRDTLITAITNEVRAFDMTLFVQQDARLTLEALDRLGYRVVGPAEHTVSRYWYVVDDVTEGISFTIGVNEFDARARAEHWVRPGTHLELREYEHWSSPVHQVSRQRVGGGV